MNDEVRQIREETLDYIILGGIALSLVAGLGILIAEGPASAWFVRVMALLLILIIAGVIRFTGRSVLAAYILVVELVGLVAETFLHTSTITSFVPYLLIPIMLIASVFFTPLGVLVSLGLSVLSLLVIAALVHQFAWVNLITLLPAFILSVLAALLGLKLNKGVTVLGERLLESRTNLKARTLEIIGVQKRLDDLQQKFVRLEQRLQRAKLEINQVQQQKLQTHHQVYDFIQELTREINSSLRKLEKGVIQVEALPEVEAQPEVLATLWQRLDHLRNLTINLEEMAQVEHGQLELNYETVDIVNLLDEVIGVARGLAREKNLAICRNGSPDLPPLQVDPARLRQVLLHVLSNAVKYTDEGRIEVQAEANEQELTILVSDTGIGLEEEEAGRVFEKFGRGSSPLSQARQGSGLGLAIDKQLIELHGGRMGLDSSPGRGTTLSLVLPLSPKERSLPKDETPPAGIRRPNLPPEPDATALSRPFLMPMPTLNTDIERLMLRRAAGTPSGPVRRFGSLYARRFIILGFVLLASIALPVVLLAFLNGPAESFTSATTESSVATTVAVLIVTLESTPTLPASSTATSTPLRQTRDMASPIASSTPTLTPSPVASPTPLPTLTATPSPQPTPTRTSTPRPPATLTPVASLPTLEPSPMPSLTPTLSLMASLYELVQVGDSQLSFSSGQSSALLANSAGLSQAKADLNVAGENSRLAWSPGGQQLLFTGDEGGDRDLYLINPTSGRPLRLAAAPGDDLQADWSPDGRQIAFSSGRTGNLEIFVMKADGSDLVQLTDSQGFDEWPVWSPAGDQIAFVSDRDGNVELYVMNVDGSNLRRLTDHPANDWPASWSPDGRRLVFASDRGDNWNLYMVEAGGGPALPLTLAPGNERDPIWSSDGQTIAFAHDGSGNWDIYTLPVPAGQLTTVSKESWRQITATAADERYPTWKP